MSQRRYYRLGIPPLQPILPSLIFDNRAEALERARQENKVGRWKGRGVKVYECDEGGRIK